MKILPSELCTDAEFVRRVYLDLTGLPPTADEVRAFLADTRDTRAKRDALIDKLIGSDEYVEHWTNKWADLLQVNRKFLGERGRDGLPQLDPRRRSPTNTPYDQFAREILTASGSNLENPPAAYYKILREPDDDDGEHHAAVPGRAVQLQQVPRPPVRALDAGPVLPDWPRTSRRSACKDDPAVRRPEDRRHGRRGRQAAGTRSSTTQATARSSTTGPGRSAPPKFPYPRAHDDARGRDPPASSWRRGSPRRRTRTSPRATSTASGATCSASASSSRSTTSAPATRRPTPSCSTA